MGDQTLYRAYRFYHLELSVNAGDPFPVGTDFHPDPIQALEVAGLHQVPNVFLVAVPYDSSRFTEVIPFHTLRNHHKGDHSNRFYYTRDSFSLQDIKEGKVLSLDTAIEKHFYESTRMG